MAGVLAVPATTKACFRDLGQTQRIIKFSICEKSSIGGDRCAVELKAQLGVEINAQTLFSAFTHWIPRFSGTLNRVIPIQTNIYSTKTFLAANIIWEIWV
jgi:hypothetical protein